MANIAKISTQERISVERLKEIINELIDAVNSADTGISGGDGGVTSKTSNIESLDGYPQMFLARNNSGTSSPYPFKQVVNASGVITDHADASVVPAGTGASLWPGDDAFRFLVVTFPAGADVRTVMLPFLPKPTDEAKYGVWYWDKTAKKIKYLECPNVTGSESYYLGVSASGPAWIINSECQTSSS